MNNGKFIVLEGIDGSGSTTQTKLLHNYLFDISKENEILTLREPTSRTSYGREIRRRLEHKLLSKDKKKIDKERWAELFVNDRKKHVEYDIAAGVDKGYQTICNRYVFSTLAYQSAQGMDLDQLIGMHDKWCYYPNLTVFLEVPVDVATERREAERGRPEYFEEKELQIKVADNYLKAFEKIGKDHHVTLIDGNRPIQEVAKNIQELVNQLYGYK